MRVSSWTYHWWLAWWTNWCSNCWWCCLCSWNWSSWFSGWSWCSCAWCWPSGARCRHWANWWNEIERITGVTLFICFVLCQCESESRDDKNRKFMKCRKSCDHILHQIVKLKTSKKLLLFEKFLWLRNIKWHSVEKLSSFIFPKLDIPRGLIWCFGEMFLFC